MKKTSALQKTGDAVARPVVLNPKPAEPASAVPKG
jgi:hypothetical protein